MAQILALDWDTHELRAVIAKTSLTGTTITHALSATIPSDSPSDLVSAISRLMAENGLAKAKAKVIVTIGRGKSELRQLTLPPVPEPELPEMVRLQAMQVFASVGENTAVDFITLPTTDDMTTVLASAVAPSVMTSVRQITAAAGLELSRIVLRPVAAAALYQIISAKNENVDDSSIVGDVVLVDLLAEDIEIVVMRGRRVMFVRTVRLPIESPDLPLQIAGELRRSLMACGINASSTSQKVVIWGNAKTHDNVRVKLAESLGCRVSTIDPTASIDAAASITDAAHTGRYAPLIGLILADSRSTPGESSPYLVDFLNPRKTIVAAPDHRKPLLIGGGIVAAAAILGFLAWSNLRGLDRDIQNRQTELASLKPQVDLAQISIDRTEVIDKFLDSSVNWLDELQRMARVIPAAEDLIVKNISANSPPRDGGGKITLSGAATSPSIVDQLSSGLRDEMHSVADSGTNDLGDKESYRWGFRELITISSQTIRDRRYEVLSGLRDAPAIEPSTTTTTMATSDAPADEPVVDSSSDDSGATP